MKLKKQLAWFILHLVSHIVLVEHQLIFLFLLGSYVITIFSRQCLVRSFVELNTQLCLRICFSPKAIRMYVFGGECPHQQIFHHFILKHILD